MRRAAQACIAVFSVLSAVALFVDMVAFQAGHVVVFAVASLAMVVACCVLALSVIALNAARRRDAERKVRGQFGLSADEMIAELRADLDRYDDPEVPR